MSLLSWSDAMCVGVREIDHQHQTLVKMANEFHDAILAGASHEALGRLLNGLISYTATHFATEERYFKQTSYPGAAAHIREHQALVAKVSDMKARFESGRMLLTIEVTKVLRDWLTHHIMEVDKQYSAHLNLAGVR